MSKQLNNRSVRLLDILGSMFPFFFEVAKFFFSVAILAQAVFVIHEDRARLSTSLGSETMPPKFAAKAKADHNTLAGLRAAVIAPAPKNQALLAPNAKGLAKAKDVAATNDGYLRVAASAADTGVLPMVRLPAEAVPDTPLVFAPFRGAAWDQPAVPNSMVAVKGANPWAQVESAMLISSVYAYENPNVHPWVFIVQILLYIVGIFLPSRVVLTDDANWAYTTNNWNFIQGANILGLDVTEDEELACKEFRSKLGDILLMLALSEGRAGLHVNRSFISELKVQEERGHGMMMTNELERQLAEMVWPYIHGPPPFSGACINVLQPWRRCSMASTGHSVLQIGSGKSTIWPPIHRFCWQQQRKFGSSSDCKVRRLAGTYANQPHARQRGRARLAGDLRCRSHCRRR